jgi:hemerythrin superfamily protein
MEVTIMTILTALKSDHDKAKKLLKTILAAEDEGQRIGMFEQFRMELTAHSRAEEKVLYARLKNTAKGKNEALEGAVEHEIVDHLMDDLASMPDAKSGEWSARCRVLQEMLEHHIEEEEDGVFRTTRDLFDRKTLDKMAGEFVAEKGKLQDETRAAAA